MWKTNTALGGKAIPAELSEEQVDLIKAAGEALGGGILGVDLIEKGSENLVLEVNGIPQYKNVVRVTRRDLSSMIIDLTVKHFKK